MAKRKLKKKSKCVYWNWNGCKIKRKGKLKLFKRKKKIKKKRKGLNKWLKAGLVALTPSALAIGHGLVKKLLKKNTGYTDIYE